MDDPKQVGVSSGRHGHGAMPYLNSELLLTIDRKAGILVGMGSDHQGENRRADSAELKRECPALFI